MLTRFARAALEKAAILAEKARAMSDTRRKYSQEQKDAWEVRAAQIGRTDAGRERSKREIAKMIAREEGFPEEAMETIRKAINTGARR